MHPRKTGNIIVTIDALDSLQIQTNSIHIRRLSILAKGIVTRSAMVKKLRKVVALYRTNPAEVLEIRGVGIKTFYSISLLSELLAANEVKSEFGVSDNLGAALTILTTLQTFGRGVSPEVKTLVEKAKDTLYKARSKVEMERLEEGLSKAIKKQTSKKG